MVNMIGLNVTELAEKVLDAEPADVLELLGVLDVHPAGEGIKEALLKEMAKIVVCNLFGLTEPEEEVAYNEAADILKHLQQKELTESIASQVKPEPVDLSALVKQQFEAKKEEELSSTIAQQILSAGVKAQLEAQRLGDIVKQQFEEAKQRAELQDVADDILDLITEYMVEAELEDSEFGMILDTGAAGQFNQLFKMMFHAKLMERGLAGKVQYEDAYTSEILTDVANILIEEHGRTLQFVSRDGHIVPVVA